MPPCVLDLSVPSSPTLYGNCSDVFRSDQLSFTSNDPTASPRRPARSGNCSSLNTVVFLVLLMLLAYLSMTLLTPVVRRCLKGTSTALRASSDAEQPAFREAETLTEMIEECKKAYVVALFYADWCPHCTHFKPEFHKLAQKLEEHSDVTVFAMNDKNVAREEMSHKVPQVVGYPTILMFNGEEVIEIVRDDAEAMAAAVIRGKNQKKSPSADESTEENLDVFKFISKE